MHLHANLPLISRPLQGMHCGRWVGNGYCLCPPLQRGCSLAGQLPYGVFSHRGLPSMGRKLPLFAFSGLLLCFALCSVLFFIFMPVFCSSFQGMFCGRLGKNSFLTLFLVYYYTLHMLHFIF